MTPLRLGSRYTLEEQMGEGGLGVVWRGTDIWTGAGYAIKLLRPEIARDAELLRRFRKEARVLAKVGSAYIASVMLLSTNGIVM